MKDPHVSPALLKRFPGGDLVAAGLADLAAGVDSDNALLLSGSATRLRDLGLPVYHPIADAEMALYRRLAKVHGDEAHSRYNALRRALHSFQRAWQCENR